MSDTGRSLFLMYNKDGGTVLAHRLQHLFHPVKTPDDMALHNDVLAEIMLIIEGKERNLLKGLVDMILYKRPKQKRFLFKVAVFILELGQMKG